MVRGTCVNGVFKSAAHLKIAINEWVPEAFVSIIAFNIISSGSRVLFKGLELV